jgi:hypothetical protein
MTDFRGNIDHWIRQAEPDYYLFFLKAWIPFNAWYVAELPNFGRQDSKIIQELQDNPKSKPRNIIENYLTNEKHDSIRFRSHLAELHHHLESKILSHNGVRLTFNAISLLANPKTFEKTVDVAFNIYKAEVKMGFYEAIIVDNGGRTILHIKQPKYEIEEFIKHNDFIRISDKKIRNKILDCYEAINPNKPVCLTAVSKIRGEYILLNSDNKTNFINDTTTIAKACLKVLYALRCMLFHGEIEPNNSNRPVYEHSYQLLRLILKHLN